MIIPFPSPGDNSWLRVKWQTDRANPFEVINVQLDRQCGLYWVFAEGDSWSSVDWEASWWWWTSGSIPPRWPNNVARRLPSPTCPSPLIRAIICTTPIALRHYLWKGEFESRKCGRPLICTVDGLAEAVIGDLCILFSFPCQLNASIITVTYGESENCCCFSFFDSCWN